MTSLAVALAVPATNKTKFVCSKFVECESNATTAAPSKPTCPGHPECSGHGQCRITSDTANSPKHARCHCHTGFFGADCGHRVHDCTKLKSCSDCQNPANTKFCGWCGADARYCLPTHVHKGLAKKNKACPAWYENTCPVPRDASNKSASLLEDWGDDRSVALAEALAAIIDAEMGEGASSWLGFFLLFGGVGLVILCTLRERRAEERRRRYAAFMSEEAETLRPVSHTGPCTPWTAMATPHQRKLGPSWDEAHADGGVPRGHSALADAIGTAAEAGAGGAEGAEATAQRAKAAAAARAAAEREAARAEAEADVLRQSVRDAARRDIEERKERRRKELEDTREAALRAERAEAAEAAKVELQEQARAALRPPPDAPPAAAETPTAPVASLTPAPIAPTQATTPATAAAVSPPPAAFAPPPPIATTPMASISAPAPPPAAATTPAPASANLAAAEAEFLAALDDFD